MLAPAEKGPPPSLGSRPVLRSPGQMRPGLQPLACSGLCLALLSGCSAGTTQPSSGAGRWRPAVADTWAWQLSGPIDTGYAVAVYDLDLFDAPQPTIDGLKAQGRRVVCYFSAGTSESWRPDFGQFVAADQGNDVAGWPGERWLDTGSASVRAIMRGRLDLARTRGCDGVEPDNVDGYANASGFALTPATQLDYNRFLASEAHVRGLAVALKNDVDQVATLASDFDFAVNEQCAEYQECGLLAPFSAAGKAVVEIEYTIGASTFCPDALGHGRSAAKMALDLRPSPWEPCR
jgi:hypothetical protein